MKPLPVFDNDETFRLWRSDSENWLSFVTDIAAGHGIVADALTAFATGTNLVVALNDHLILKLFPPMYRSQFLSERATLRQLHGQLQLPIPEVMAEGEREGWPYLVITRLGGTLGSEAWPHLAENQKERILGQIGETIAAVQSVPVGDLDRIEPAWPDFVAKQIAGCRQRHTRLGLPQDLLLGLDDMIAQAPAIIPMDARPVILTGEYIPENFLLRRAGDEWELAGLIDFGDVLTGWREYDLLGPSTFMAAGKPGRVRRLFEGFGYRPEDIDPALTRRLLTLTLLHRASDLRKLCIANWQQEVGSLADLERLIWPIER